MPILDRTPDPVPPPAAPAPRIPLPPHEVTIPARLRRLLTPSRRAWPTTIALVTLIVFIMVRAETTLLFGTGWITQRRRTPDSPRSR